MKLIQEEYDKEPWKIFIACVLLNRTKGKTVRPVVENLFSKWPTSESLSSAELEEVKNVIRPCGIHSRKAKIIKEIARIEAEGGKKLDFLNLSGIGKYAVDSYRLFFEKDTTVEPKDAKLIERMNELKKERNET